MADATSSGGGSRNAQAAALAAAAGRQREGGQAAELESMRAMNEAMLAELEAMALAADDLSSQNVRLLQLAAERDDVNKLLMTKARTLRDVKAAEASERDALAQRLQASEQARAALEDVARSREALLRASEDARRDRDASLLSRDRDASACVEAGNRAVAQVEDAKAAEAKAAAASGAHEARVAVLAEEGKQLRAQRDALEEQSEATQVRQKLRVFFFSFSLVSILHPRVCAARLLPCRSITLGLRVAFGAVSAETGPRASEAGKGQAPRVFCAPGKGRRARRGARRRRRIGRRLGRRRRVQRAARVRKRKLEKASHVPAAQGKHQESGVGQVRARVFGGRHRAVHGRPQPQVPGVSQGFWGGRRQAPLPHFVNIHTHTRHSRRACKSALARSAKIQEKKNKQTSKHKLRN
jgi:hypothetical protein